MSKVREMLLQKREEGEREAERWANDFCGQCRDGSCRHTAAEHSDARWHLASVLLDLLEEVRSARQAGFSEKPS